MMTTYIQIYDETEDEFADGIEDDEEDNFDVMKVQCLWSQRSKGYQIFEARAFKKAKRRMNEGGMKSF